LHKELAHMTDLKKTPLTDLHASLGARMVPFAGYEMPVQYPAGIMKEHLQTRAAAGLFDVSHMGQVTIRPRSGDIRDAALALETLVPVDVVGLAEGRQRYAVFTDDAGGILDDLMIAHRGDHLFLVVNAARKEEDLALLEAGLGATCIVEALPHRALLALQGPAAESALATLAPEVAEMRFMDVRAVDLVGAGCIVSRSGYTGEDGYEISVPAADATRLAEALLAIDGVEPVGLGARDSLRLEAGLCLHGNDIDTTTTPVEAALEWAIQKVRRCGGEREGGFPGADVVLRQLTAGAPRRRVGLRPETKAPIRAGTLLYASESGGEPAGRVTSGSFAPTLEAPVAMGYVPTEQAGLGTRLFAEVRGKRLPVTVTPLPFVTPGYKRR
jgi:aminomethyltransferase